uniref:VWFD domain-containing protein n=1 Tax=Trichogramma kaykai TaxID=54128 RepID=A0ABD2XHM4_9HYME
MDEEILTGFLRGQEEFDELEKNSDLHQELILLMGNSKAREDFFNDRASEFVDLTVNVTILPHLMLNTRTKTEFLDFFIMEEEIKSVQHIPRVYFTRKIVNLVSAVKLLLLVDFPSFDKQIDALLQKAAESFKDVRKFLNGVGLIVTQVQNEQQIQKVKDNLKNLVKSPERSNKITSIIDALHVKNEGMEDWNRLGFVESPSSSSLEIYKIKNLERMIYKSIVFTSHNSNDIIYTPCQNKPRICDILLDLLRRKLSEGITQIGQDMLNVHALVEKQLHDLQKSLVYFSHALDSYHTFFRTEEISKKGTTNPGQVIERIVEYSRAVTADLSNKNLQLSADYAKYFVFLRGPNMPDDNSWILNQLLPVHNYLETSKQWYQFLLNLDKKILSDWMVQKDISPYKNVTSQLLEEIEKVKHKKDYDITVSLNNLLSSLPEQQGNQKFESSKVTQLEVPKLEVLKKLLSETLMHNGPSVKCDTKSKKLTISGSYVKLSDVSKSNCDKAKFIEVFALNKIFFDKNFIEDDMKVHLVIIAPYWDVIGQDRLIFLFGEEVDEKPGRPPAGHFLGIGRIFTNSSDLLVSAEGQVEKSGTVTIIGLEKSNPNLNVMDPEGRISNTSIASSEKTPKSFGRSINSYQLFLRGHLMGNIRQSRLERFSWLLADSEAIIDLYDVPGLIDEFRQLEDQFWQQSPKMSLLPFHRSLLNQIKGYANKLEDYKQLTHDKVNILRFLYAAALSIIVNLENNVDAYLVVDLDTFLNSIKHDVDSVRKLKNAQIIYGYTRNYLQEFETKIKEAQHYVTEVISPEIHNTIMKLDEAVVKLIDETVALQEAAKKEKEELIKKQESLTSSMILTAVFGVIKVASLFLNFLGPIGMAVSMGIITLTSMSESLLVDSSGVDENALLKLPGALKESLKPMTFYLNNKKDLLNQQLTDARSMFNALSEQEKSDIKGIEREIKNAQNELMHEIGQGKTLDPASVDKMNNLRKKIKDLCSDKITELEKKKPQVDSKVSKQLKLVNKVQNTLSIVETSVDTYQKIKSQQNKIDEVGDLIRRADQKIEQLKQYEQNIYDIIVPVCKNVEASIDRVQEQLEGKSSEALVINKWKIQGALKGVMNEIKKMTEGFQVQGEFLDIFNKVEEGINVMVELYNIMDEYQYKAELGKFIANINTHASESVVTNNYELNEALNDLMLVIQNNVVMQNYKVAAEAVKRNVFPFAHAFFAYYNLPEILKTNKTDVIVTHVLSEIEQLKYELLKSDARIDKYDRFVHQNIVFNGRKGRSKPFYKWKYNEHKNNIEKLLHGHRVTLKADIKHGFKGNAVKFNKIGINFSSPNKTINLKLRKLLRGFSITMIHLGHSFYRCDDRIYMIPSANQTIDYSMTKPRGSNVPATTNKVYDKIAKNEPVLSPYATWQIQLNGDKDCFDELSKYGGETIDLVLEGTGQYVDLNLPEVCNEQLDRYYTRCNNQTDGIQVYEKTPEFNLKSVHGSMDDFWMRR